MPLKTLALFAFFAILFNTSFTQTFSNATVDTLFPVINRFNESYDTSFAGSSESAFVMQTLKSNGKYYLLGNFTNLSTNQGSSLVIDTLTKEIKTPQRWKIDGTVISSIADGHGGFYIAGLFSKIGDSSRSNVAQIDRFGRPTAWRLDANDRVNQIALRRDTLYLAGAFSMIGGRPRKHFALLSLKGDSLINTRSLYPGFQYINSFLIDRDTMIFGGRIFSGPSRSLLKYCIKGDSMMYSWRLNYIDYASVNHLEFNKDSSIILYSADYNGVFITALDKITGVRRYQITPTRHPPPFGSNGDGPMPSFKVVGDKVYLAGDFVLILRDDSYVGRRNGFATFSASSGTLYNESIRTSGHLSFLDVNKGKLYISGKFTAINGISRENFAVLDTGSYKLDSFQLAPTDPLSLMSYSGGSLFVSGYFNGLYSTKRKNFAVIDSATGKILPSPLSGLTGLFSNYLFEIKKMRMKGDTLFILAVTNRPAIGCRTNDYTAELYMYRISTGERVRVPIDFSYDYARINNFELIDTYIYISYGDRFFRFDNSSLKKDDSFFYVGYGEILTDFVVSGDTIYAIGDNRFERGCGFNQDSYVTIHKISKSTGSLLFTKKYSPANPQYDQPVFEQALLLGSKMYIQGIFYKLNNVARTNYVCININDGSITDWHPTFVDSNKTKRYSAIQKFELHDNKIWITGTTRDTLSNGQHFSGFASIDPVSAALNQQIYVDQFGSPGRYNMPYDFIFTENAFLLFGDFDIVNGTVSNGMIRYFLNHTLPLNLLSFQASKIGKFTKINWRTINEKNTSLFEVEKKTQGLTYEKIGTVKASNNDAATVNDYELFDRSPSIGTNYYRLKSIDKDGNFTFSSVRSVVFNNSEEIFLYPNPTWDKVVVAGTVSQIRIIDNLGKIVLTEKCATTSPQQTIINVKALQKGFYFVECTLITGKTIIKKLVVN